MFRPHHYLIALTALLLTPTLLHAEQVSDDSAGEVIYDDSVKIFIRKRNAHACMMSIVFDVLFPLGAISLHLPLPQFLRRIKIVPSVHAPIQILGLAMMIGAMGLGINVAQDRHFFSGGSVPAHVAIGLLATSTIILIQPALGILQHLYFRKTGKKSLFGYIHRWTGRVAIILGMINQGLGFQLCGIGTNVQGHSLVRNFVILGVLGGTWVALASWDAIRGELKRRKGAVANREEKQEVSEAPNSSAGLSVS